MTNKTTYLLQHPNVLRHYILSKIKTRDLTSKYKSDILESEFRTLLEKDSGYVWFDCCEYIYALIRKYRPKTVVETGIRYGFSSLFILKALYDNSFGTLYSIEPEKIIKNSGLVSGWVVRVEYIDRWNIIWDYSYRALPSLLDKLGSIDMFLHDSEHSVKNMSFEYNLAKKYIKDGFYLSDDSRSYPDFYKQAKKEKAIFYDRLSVLRVQN